MTATRGYAERQRPMTVTRGPETAWIRVVAAQPSPLVEESDNSAVQLIVGLVLIALLTAVHDLWPAQLLLVVLLFTVPGMILLRALRIPWTTVANSCMYVPAASVLVLTASGLAVDQIGPLGGITAPLRAVPLLAALELTCAVLLMVGWNAPSETRIRWDMIERPVALAWPIILPLAGAAGALRLNSGHGNTVAVIALFLVIATLVLTFVRAPWNEDAYLVVIVFACALALMWSFSLRGDLVYGFDISNEYHSLTQTVTAGVWHFAHPNDAYGAMLSVTLLPAEVHELSGVPALLVFKLVYPVVGAFFPVGVFCLARRLLAGRWAFMAACLVIIQQTFFQQFTALTRQEIATVLFVTLIAVILDTGESRSSRFVFVSLLSLGVVVSHYSTAYLAIPVLGMAVGLQFVVSWFKRIPRVTGVVLLAFVVTLGGAVVWYGALTQSASNVSGFVQTANGQGLNLLPNSSGGNLLSAYLAGENSADLTPAQYQAYVDTYYKEHFPFVKPLAAATQPQYALQDPADDAAPPVKSQAVASGLSFVDLLVQQSTNLLAGIGSLILVFRRKQRAIVSLIGFLGLAGMVILIMTRLSGTIAQEYNPERAFLQLLSVLGIIIAWFFQWFGANYKWSRGLILVTCAGILGLFLVGTTGFSAALLGGGTQANLANDFTDFNSFVVNSQDLASATWLTGKASPGQIIESDRYGELRLETLVGNRSAMFPDMTPQTTDAHAWIYATRTNLVGNQVNEEVGADSGSYAFPSLFFNQNFNVVYSNGTSEVFHR
jgi:uncharacterized membrane protein